MRKLFLAAVAATGMMAAAPASADVFDGGIFEENEYSVFSDSFGIWDQDDDGWLSDDEFEDGWNEVGFNDSDGAFEEFDNDRNGFLDDDEFFEDDEFEVLDSDQDGVLTDGEWY